MYEKVEKPKENGSRAVANGVGQKKSDGRQGVGFEDNQSRAINRECKVFGNKENIMQYRMNATLFNQKPNIFGLASTPAATYPYLMYGGGVTQMAWSSLTPKWASLRHAAVKMAEFFVLGAMKVVYSSGGRARLWVKLGFEILETLTALHMAWLTYKNEGYKFTKKTWIALLRLAIQITTLSLTITNLARTALGENPTKEEKKDYDNTTTMYDGIDNLGSFVGVGLDIYSATMTKDNDEQQLPTSDSVLNTSENSLSTGLVQNEPQTDIELQKNTADHEDIIKIINKIEGSINRLGNINNELNEEINKM